MHTGAQQSCKVWYVPTQEVREQNEEALTEELQDGQLRWRYDLGALRQLLELCVDNSDLITAALASEIGILIDKNEETHLSDLNRFRTQFLPALEPKPNTFRTALMPAILSRTRAGWYNGYGRVGCHGKR